MPVRSIPFRYLSYITALGDEVVLASENNHKLWECYGRKGFYAPDLEYVKREYADGITDVLAIIPKPRTLTVKMFVLGKTMREKDAILRDIASRLIQVGSKRDWGKLRVRRSDGVDLYIDCVYVGGLDSIVERYPNVQEFELKFFSGNGYFYDKDETLLATKRLSDLVYLSDNLYLSDDTYLVDGSSTVSVMNQGELYYPSIDIFGPASAIHITNNATGITVGVDESFSIASGQKIIFNCQENNKSIVFVDTNGSETDITDKLLLGSSLLWPIIKGRNDISFYYSNSSEDTLARLRYRQRYFSI